MTRPAETRRELEERRNARIRQLRDQRGDQPRRRFQPLVLLLWFAGVIALVGVLVFVGFLAFSPQMMSWVESHPGSIDNGVVRSFVQWYKPESLADEPASDSVSRISFTVEDGATDSEIGQQLYEAGLIESRLAFQLAVLEAGREGTLAAGTYDLSPSLRPSQIVAALRQEPGEEVQITLREGLRLEEMVGYLSNTQLTMNLEQFANLAEHPPADLVNQYDFLDDLPAGRSLEGYLYPDTYRIDANASPTEVIELLLTTFGERLTPEMRDQIEAQGLTIDKAVRVASIVEREAVLDRERPLIAGVYLNRYLNPDNPQTNGLLNADPTLQYALASARYRKKPVDSWGTLTWWPRLQVGGLDVQLPPGLAGYQTYLNPGLPPTPIAAPRIASLAAVADPDGADGYLYFVAACPDGTRDGSHYFARTYAEHQANIARANAECAGS
jgi:UPF0755 protein